MSARASSVIAVAAVALLALGALRVAPHVPDAPPAAAVVLRPVASPPPRVAVRHDTLARGEALASLLARAGVARGEVAAALRAAFAGPLDARRVPAGLAVSATRAADSASASEVVLHLATGRDLRLTREAGGTWDGREERATWTTDTVALAGTVHSTLYDAMDGAAPDLPRAARAELAWTLADIFEYRVDMSRDLQDDDRFSVLYERERTSDGATRVGRVIAATFTLSGDSVAAVRYASAGASGEYFDQGGKSLKAHYLRAPLEFRRISSLFGRRFHPILGIWRQHKGLDYAASQGTPVRAIGDGVVTRAGQSHGYGNLLEIRLRNGYVTRYGHLRGFASGIRAGASVNVGQTVGYVGQTGLATAPHLHFEFLLGGAQRDPRSVFASLRGGEPIAPGERSAFARVRDRLLAALARPTLLAQARAPGAAD